MLWWDLQWNIKYSQLCYTATSEQSWFTIKVNQKAVKSTWYHWTPLKMLYFISAYHGCFQVMKERPLFSPTKHKLRSEYTEVCQHHITSWQQHLIKIIASRNNQGRRKCPDFKLRRQNKSHGTIITLIRYKDLTPANYIRFKTQLQSVQNQSGHHIMMQRLLSSDCCVADCWYLLDSDGLYVNSAVSSPYCFTSTESVISHAEEILQE